MAKAKITPKQKLFLEFLMSHEKQYGYAPSQREIADHFGWKSLGTVQDYVNKLTEKGVLEAEKNGRRSLRVNRKLFPFATPSRNTEIKVMGRIAAGTPIEAITTRNRYHVDVPKSMVSDGEHFALEVEGNSMIEEGIFPRDLIIVRSQASADDGEMVVALIDNDATVKRIHFHSKKKKKIELRPANSTMESMWYTPKECVVQGVVVGLYRHY